MSKSSCFRRVPSLFITSALFASVFAIADGPQPPLERGQCLIAHQNQLNLCATFHNDPDPDAFSDCVKAAHLFLEVCLRQAPRADPPPSPLSCLDEYNQIVSQNCGDYRANCKNDQSSVDCSLFRACRQGALRMYRDCLGLDPEPTLATSIELEPKQFVVYPLSPKLKVTVTIGDDLPDGNLELLVNTCDANGNLDTNQKLVALLFGVKPGSYEIEFIVPEATLDCDSANLFAVLRDSNNQPVMVTSALLIIGWHGGDFNHDGVVNALDLLDAAIALGEGLITQAEYESIENAVVAAQSGN